MTEKSKNICLVGLNHTTAPLELREKMAFPTGCMGDSYDTLKNKLGVDELVILSTCNRTEIYAVIDNSRAISDWLAEAKNVSNAQLQPHLYHLENIDVLDHAAKVASGINSMVLGETQILGQMKSAFKFSEELNCLGGMLRKVFELSFSIAKDVRSKTDIGVHSVSMASVALRIIDRIYPDISSKSVLFVGAGEMIELFVRHFSQRPFKSFTFANRTRSKAESLASAFKGDNLDLIEIGGRLSQFDVVISCTSSNLPLLGKGAFEYALKIRKRSPIVVIDLAVPRDVEVSVGTLDDIFLFSVDDLGVLVERGVNNRQAAVKEASAIIRQRIADFSGFTEVSGSVEILKKYRKFGADLVENELTKSLKALRANGDPEEIIYGLSNALGKKFLDRPSRMLNKARGSERDELGLALSKLFNLDDQI